MQTLQQCFIEAGNKFPFTVEWHHPALPYPVTVTIIRAYAEQFGVRWAVDIESYSNKDAVQAAFSDMIDFHGGFGELRNYKLLQPNRLKKRQRWKPPEKYYSLNELESFVQYPHVFTDKNGGLFLRTNRYEVYKILEGHLQQWHFTITDPRFLLISSYTLPNGQTINIQLKEPEEFVK